MKRKMNVITAGITLLIVFALPAIGQQAPPSATSTVKAMTPKCSPHQHWDAAMAMCVAGEAPATTAPCQLDSSRDADSSACVPEMNPETSLMFHINQFMLYSSTTGKRGESRTTGPAMWMLMYDAALTPSNHLRIKAMGSPEQSTVRDKGTPQLLQTEHIDSFHAHDTFLAFEVRDVIALGANGSQRLTLLFAPRGEAAIGPVPFMHRDSAEGNPDAPLAHALQDGFHDVSTVVGVEYQRSRTTVEVTGFSGHDLRWPLPLHRVDSYSFRVNQVIDPHFSVGASYADALLPEDAGGALHNQFVAAWLTTSHAAHGGTLKSSLIWGQAHAHGGAAFDSFLEELVYQHNNDKIFGRAEILEIAPAQLDVEVPNGAAKPKWVSALTAGYERTLFRTGKLMLYIGGSYTRDHVPTEFRPAYGSAPAGAKVYLRIKIDNASMSGEAMPGMER